LIRAFSPQADAKRRDFTTLCSYRPTNFV